MSRAPRLRRPLRAIRRTPAAGWAAVALAVSTTASCSPTSSWRSATTVSRPGRSKPARLRASRSRSERSAAPAMCPVNFMSAETRPASRARCPARTRTAHSARRRVHGTPPGLVLRIGTRLDGPLRRCPPARGRRDHRGLPQRSAAGARHGLPPRQRHAHLRTDPTPRPHCAGRTTWSTFATRSTGRHGLRTGFPLPLWTTQADRARSDSDAPARDAATFSDKASPAPKQSLGVTHRLWTPIAPLMNDNGARRPQLGSQRLPRSNELRSVSPDRSRRLVGTDGLAADFTMDRLHS